MMARARGSATGTFRLEGVPELRRQLRKLDDAQRAEVRKAITTTVEAIAERARARIPVKSGAGRRGIRARVNKKGTAGRVTHPKKLFYLRFLEFGTRKMKPRPWLFPSAEEERAKHPARMRAALERAQNQVTKGG